MNELERATILKPFAELSEQIRQAEDLLSSGEEVAALRAIYGIKKQIGQVTVMLIVQCLRKNLEAIAGEDQLSYEMRMHHLFETLNFALLALCPECQQEIRTKLMEV